jgi:hypothetical protein
MNARDGHFVKRPKAFPAALAARLVASSALCALSAACVGNPFADAKVDPRSPIAKEVATSVKPDAAYPNLAAIPGRPKDVRPVRQFGVAAADVDKAAAQLTTATSEDKFTLQNTDIFAAEAQAAAATGDAPPPATSAADTEAFASTLRKRATPPPPAKH